MSSALDWLRGRTDEQLTALLTARPDLLVPAPGDLPALARRLDSTAAARRAIEHLDQFALAVLTAIAVLADRSGTDRSGTDRSGTERSGDASHTHGTDNGDASHTDDSHPQATHTDGTHPHDTHPHGSQHPRKIPITAERIAEFLGGPATAEEIAWQLDTLEAKGLVRGTEGVRLPSSTREALGPYPGGLGPPAGLDRQPLNAALQGLDDAGRGILERLAPGPPLGQVDPQSPTAALAEDLVQRHLLTRLDRYTVRIPREVALALRGARPLGPVDAEAPQAAGEDRGVAIVDGTAAGQSLAVHAALAALLTAFGSGRIAALKSGGIGIVALRRLAKDLGATVELTAAYVEILCAAGLIAPVTARSGDSATWTPTQAADSFLAGSEAGGWAWAATTWMQMRRDPSRAGTKDPAGKVNNVLAPELSWRAAPAERHRVLDEIAGLPPGTSADRDLLVRRLLYRAPLRSPALIRMVADAVLAEATALGVVAYDAISAAGREVLLDDPEAAAAALDLALPAPVEAVVIQADLTVVAPGRLEPALAQALSLAAEVESAGGATVYRVTPASLRSAFDAGVTREELHRLFDEHSATAVPQALGYLIDDVARRHGVLRAGRAGAYVRSEDPALITAAIGAATAAGLVLRRLAPTVAVSEADLPPLVDALRSAGLVPAAEDAGGGLLDLRPQPRRTRITLPTHTTWREPAAPSAEQIAGLVRRLRAADAVDTGEQSSGEVLAVLRDAAGTRTPLWIGYADAEGGTSRRIVEPIVVSGGSLLAYDRLRRAVRTFAVHRISSAHPDPGVLAES